MTHSRRPLTVVQVKLRHREAGVALVIALVVVAIAVTTLAPGAVRERVAVAHTANVIDRLQARALAHGVLTWASGVLDTDGDGDSVDFLGEPWTTPVPGLAAGRGVASGALVDLRSRLNLNALIDERGLVNGLQLARLQRLLALLKLDASVAGAIVDWVDADDVEQLGGGAESAYYLQLEPAYRSANQPFASVSELRLVAGMKDANVVGLAPFVSALDDDMTINVNTATLNVLLALGGNLQASLLEDFVQRRVASPARGFADIRAEQGFSDGLESLRGLNIISDDFLLRARIQLPRAVLDVRCRLRRSSTGTKAQRCWEVID